MLQLDLAQRVRHDDRRNKQEAPMSSIRPRRSVLYMPGANERALEKAKTAARRTALILDLEDAGRPHAKAEARDQASAAAVTAGGYRPARALRHPRQRAATRPWGEADIEGRRPRQPRRHPRPQGRVGPATSANWLE